jgi:hypothetical protein
MTMQQPKSMGGGFIPFDDSIQSSTRATMTPKEEQNLFLKKEEQPAKIVVPAEIPTPLPLDND